MKGMMLGAPEVLQLNSILMKSIGKYFENIFGKGRGAPRYDGPMEI